MFEILPRNKKHCGNVKDGVAALEMSLGCSNSCAETENVVWDVQIHVLEVKILLRCLKCCSKCWNSCGGTEDVVAMFDTLFMMLEFVWRN
jgi:hypothetical protein